MLLLVLVVCFDVVVVVVLLMLGVSSSSYANCSLCREKEVLSTESSAAVASVGDTGRQLLVRVAAVLLLPLLLPLLLLLLWLDARRGER